MTKKEIYAELQEWQFQQKVIGGQIAVLGFLGISNVPLLQTLRGIAEAHTDVVAKLVGDKTGALRWWKEQCAYGDRPLSAGKGDKIRPIKTLKQLAGLICEP